MRHFTLGADDSVAMSIDEPLSARQDSKETPSEFNTGANTDDAIPRQTVTLVG